MRNVITSLIITIMVSGCAVENFDPNKIHISQPKSTMPNQYDRPTPSQRAAIMSGERPDWDKKDGSSVGYGVAR